MSLGALKYALPGGGGAATSTSAAFAQDAQRPTTVGEVIVTTQRRAERLRDVPVAINVQTGAALQNAGVTYIKGLIEVVPGTRIDQTSDFVQPAIRGVSSAVVGLGTDAPAALYLDGVLQPNQSVNHFQLADIDRIEVAKGPQGTLFGRNATAGAISIFTKAQSLTAMGSIEAGYSSFKERTGLTRY